MKQLFSLFAALIFIYPSLAYSGPLNDLLKTHKQIDALKGQWEIISAGSSVFPDIEQGTLINIKSRGKVKITLDGEKVGSGVTKKTTIGKLKATFKTKLKTTEIFGIPEKAKVKISLALTESDTMQEISGTIGLLNNPQQVENTFFTARRVNPAPRARIRLKLKHPKKKITAGKRFLVTVSATNRGPGPVGLRTSSPAGASYVLVIAFPVNVFEEVTYEKRDNLRCNSIIREPNVIVACEIIAPLGPTKPTKATLSLAFRSELTLEDPVPMTIFGISPAKGEQNVTEHEKTFTLNVVAQCKKNKIKPQHDRRLCDIDEGSLGLAVTCASIPAETRRYILFYNGTNFFGDPIYGATCTDQANMCSVIRHQVETRQSHGFVIASDVSTLDEYCIKLRSLCSNHRDSPFCS